MKLSQTLASLTVYEHVMLPDAFNTGGPVRVEVEALPVLLPLIDLLD